MKTKREEMHDNLQAKMADFDKHELSLAFADVLGVVGNLASFRGAKFRGAKFMVFHMKKPGTRNLKVQVTFTPEGIAIQGDVGIGPTDNGVCSTLGYGLGWWVSDLSRDYLAQKFLRKCWSRDLAIVHCEDHIACEKSELSAIGPDADPDDISEIQGRITAFSEAIERLGDLDFDQRDLHESLEEAGIDMSDSFPGFGFDPDEEGWLVAIQRTFKRLWDAAAKPAPTQSETHEQKVCPSDGVGCGREECRGGKCHAQEAAPIDAPRSLDNRTDATYNEDVNDVPRGAGKD